MVFIMDKSKSSNELKKSTIAIINYESASVKLMTIENSVLEQYADDYDVLVYGVMGYKPESVYYMISDSITVIDNR